MLVVCGRAKSPRLLHGEDDATASSTSLASPSFSETDTQEVSEGTSDTDLLSDQGAPCCHLARERARNSVKLALEEPGSSSFGLVLNYIILGMIILSTLSAILETVKEVQQEFERSLHIVEDVITIIFTAEIAVRVWVAVSWRQYLCGIANLVDILAILPWYVEAMYSAVCGVPAKDIHSEACNSWMMGSFRTMRIIRMLRLMKIGRHSEQGTIVFASLSHSSDGLWVLVCLLVAGTTLPATVVYAAEGVATDTVFPTIPTAMWWAVATITTVGYGDVVPDSLLGRLMAVLTMLGGVLFMSMSVALVTTSFIEQYRNRSAEGKVRALMQVRQAEHEMASCQESLRRLTSSTTSRLLMDRFQSLEEEINTLLTLLQGIHMEVLADHDAAASATPTGDGRSDQQKWSVDQQDDVSRLLLNNLREQFALVFTSARGLVEEGVLECLEPDEG